MNLDKYIGIPYVSNGRDFKGLDCFGLLLTFYKNELGISLSDYLPENISYWKRAASLEAFPTMKLLHDVDKLELYDMVFFKVLDEEGTGWYNHVAIYLGSDKILNTSRCTGAVITRLSTIERFITNKCRYGEKCL